MPIGHQDFGETTYNKQDGKYKASAITFRQINKYWALLKAYLYKAVKF